MRVRQHATGPFGYFCSALLAATCLNEIMNSDTLKTVVCKASSAAETISTPMEESPNMVAVLGGYESLSNTIWKLAMVY
jgi:hypothetical protein